MEITQKCNNDDTLVFLKEHKYSRHSNSTHQTHKTKNLGQNSKKQRYWSRFLAELLIKAFGIKLEEVAAQQDGNAAQQLRVYAVAVEDSITSHAASAQLLAQPYDSAPLSL